MGWFSRKPATEKKTVLDSVLPRDDERAGPAPPPPPSATPPGVAVFAFSDACDRSTRADESTGRFFLEGKRRESVARAMLVLKGKAGTAGSVVASPGDVLLGNSAVVRALDAAAEVATFLLFEEFSLAENPRGALDPLSSPASPASPSSTPSLRHIRRDDLGGRGVSGITGIRTLVRLPDLAVVRLGPPPGARWAVVGLRSFAVFSGRITAIDGDEPHDVNAGQFATIADPKATLYLQAGNDSALGIGFADPGLVVALG